MSQLVEGGWITVIGITVVFAILTILAIVMYAIGAFERGMTRKAEKAEEKAIEETKEEIEVVEEIPPRDLAIITASILAYLAKKAEIARPLPFRRKVSDAWRLYGLQSGMDEVENFNYEMRKW
ncbi:OadG family protein [Thermococcus sp. AM4]|uniref:OadG family protein n=1 Tax=Thermococcus sp. (strain AM4) TaxID=246969 RepID=UPI0001870898|nr:OadG family protein [Thermococcus sp. AM4]EEB74098.1 Methylmalonyl-CoA decarboxylase delta chain [Thermococcus sp. AM4]